MTDGYSGSPRALTKRDHVVRELRRLLANGDFTRGARIRQQDLAKRFNTSITPVREALRLLEAEGLLVGEPHRGVRVASANIERITGIYIARRLLESYATARAVPRISARDIDKAQLLLKQIRQSVHDGESSSVTSANRAFHFLIFSRSEMVGLVSVIQDLWAKYPWDILEAIPRRAQASLVEHESLLAAIAAGDEAKAALAAAKHVQESFLALTSYLTGSTADPFVDEMVESRLITGFVRPHHR